MPVNGRLPVKRLIAEGFVIVVSVLLALGADARWDGRQQEEAVANHLRALRRDFGQMRARMDSVVDQSSRNIEASQFLLLVG